MRWQWNMFQVKEQDKTPEELSQVEIGNLHFKKERIQNNDHKDDLRTRGKNGCRE